MAVGQKNTIDLPGGTTEAMVAWEGDTLVTKIDDGFQNRRFVEGDKYAVEMISPKGKTMRRVHTRK